MQELMPLTLAAQRLSQSWERTWRMVLSGRIAGEKRGGRWLVSAADVEAVRGEENVATGREAVKDLRNQTERETEK